MEIYEDLNHQLRENFVKTVFVFWALNTIGFLKKYIQQDENKLRPKI